MLNAEEGDGRAEEFMAKIFKACSSHFDPHVNMKKIGLANQTMMYKKETRAIGQMLQKTITLRHSFLTFDPTKGPTTSSSFIMAVITNECGNNRKGDEP